MKAKDSPVEVLRSIFRCDNCGTFQDTGAFAHLGTILVTLTKYKENYWRARAVASTAGVLARGRSPIEAACELHNKMHKFRIDLRRDMHVEVPDVIPG